MRRSGERFRGVVPERESEAYQRQGPRLVQILLGAGGEEHPQDLPVQLPRVSQRQAAHERQQSLRGPHPHSQPVGPVAELQVLRELRVVAPMAGHTAIMRLQSERMIWASRHSSPEDVEPTKNARKLRRRKATQSSPRPYARTIAVQRICTTQSRVSFKQRPMSGCTRQPSRGIQSSLYTAEENPTPEPTVAKV